MSNNTNTTLSVFAQALMDNRNYKSAKIDGEAVGVAKARQWSAAVKALRLPAYAVRVYRHDHMGDAEAVAACDLSALYAPLCELVGLIGVVNGAKLSAQNLCEEIISNSVRFRTIDTSEEMAHARCEKKLAREALSDDDTEENQSAYDQWCDEVKRLEGLPGNCKKIPEVQTEAAFVNAVELLLGDAILKQTMKSAEEVAAEEEAKRQARREKAKAKKQAKKSQEKKAA